MAKRYPIAREEGKRICLEQESTHVPRYTTSHAYIVVTGKKGSAPGELDSPSGVAIHEDTHQIFIANKLNDRVEVFSEMGEFLYQLGGGQLFRPYSIAIHGDSVYVSSWGDRTISKFSINEMCCVRRIRGSGSNYGQFRTPRQLTTDSIGCVFLLNTHNDRICIHDPDLNLLRYITIRFGSGPSDVKVSRDLLYILSPFSNPCIQVLTLEGDKLYSLIRCGEGNDVLDPQVLCLDPLNNFIISDYRPSLNSCLLFRVIHTMSIHSDSM